VLRATIDDLTRQLEHLESMYYPNSIALHVSDIQCSVHVSVSCPLMYEHVYVYKIEGYIIRIMIIIVFRAKQ